MDDRQKGGAVSSPVQVTVSLVSADEVCALNRVREGGWRALTAREALLCQQVLVRVAGALAPEPESRPD